MKILILGGYGGVGRALTDLLLQETEHKLFVAGRRIEKAAAFAKSINKKYHVERVTPLQIIVNDSNSLKLAFSGFDLVIVTATIPDKIETIAQAALDSKSDMLDILFQKSVVTKLKRFSESIQNSGRVFITQAGFHPGLPAVLVRFASKYFDVYQKGIVSMAMNARFEQPESTVEILNEVREFDSEIFKHGSWRKGSYKDSIRVDFGVPFGTKMCYPLHMEELKKLPEKYGLTETGAYVAGFNWFVDYIVFPVILGFHWVKRGWGDPFLKWIFYWGVNTFSSDDQKVVIILDAEGLSNGKKRNVRITLEHNDAYFFTAAPIVASLKQYFSSSIPRPGLHLMGEIVDPDNLLAEMKRMGVKIQIESKDI